MQAALVMEDLQNVLYFTLAVEFGKLVQTSFLETFYCSETPTAHY
jgi:hypothetical protein